MSLRTKTNEIALCKLKFAENKQTSFSGYASTFDFVDAHGESFAIGAFDDVIKSGKAPKMFFNHDSRLVPIGKWNEMHADDYGLYVSGEFTPGIKLAEEVCAALKHETIDGLSVGFTIKRSDIEVKNDVTVLKRVASLDEISIVNFPANKQAEIDITSIKSIRDAEKLLRDAVGMSRTETKRFLSILRDSNLRDADTSEEIEEIKKRVFENSIKLLEI